ncbi:DUF3310 domain-containing protein [Streptomyces antibioticus]|uniref:DUF3310 domain-containing protein n=1 Tax=Streptomyces antibioticus TaxID=1890 RepID=UPI0034025928
MKYKIGDRVRIGPGPWAGATGEVITVNGAITSPYPYGVRFTFNGRKRSAAFPENELEPFEGEKADPVNHPSHYKVAGGVEVIDLTEHLTFNRGNAVKYLARAGKKNPETEIEDLEKASWYVHREIQRLKGNKVDG